MDECDRETVLRKTKEIVMEVLDVDADEVESNSSLIDDLGAESIDFLDLSFKIEKEFGVKFPEREVAQLGSMIKDKRLEVIEDLLERRFGVKLSEGDRQELMDLELSALVEKLNSEYHVDIGPDLIAKGSQSVMRKIIAYLAGLGFIIPSDGLENFASINIEDSPFKIQKKIMDFFTVQLLADFVCQKQST